MTVRDNFWQLIEGESSYFLLILSSAENKTKSLQDCQSLKDQDISVPMVPNDGPIILVFGHMKKNLYFSNLLSAS